VAGVINDIEMLAEFRAHLIQFNEELAESFTNIRGHWRELGEVWRDDMYQLFGEALEEVTPGIELYLSATEAHEAHLANLIEQLRGYLEAGYAVTARDQTSARRTVARLEASGEARATGRGVPAGRGAAGNGSAGSGSGMGGGAGAT
jgi:hypothetical protein